MEHSSEIATIESASTENTALYLITKSEVDAAISTAKAFPRSIQTFLQKAESMATVSESVAESCNYALPRGGKSLQGPSVRLAEIICATYGNIRSGARVIANDGKTITAQGICHDLETNNCVTVEVKRRITDRNGRTFNDDMQTVTGNAACAIAFRNAVFKAVPAALINEIYEKTKEVAKGTAETLPQRRDKAIKYFKDLGVTEKQICEVLELRKIEDIDLDTLSTLRGMVSAIKNGETTVKDLFEAPHKEEDAKKAAADKLKDLKKDIKQESLNL
ncbi:MAG: hypothetical protein ACREHG_00290 [Candidatus Saccharimonadales bacterium]